MILTKLTIHTNGFADLRTGISHAADTTITCVERNSIQQTFLSVRQKLAVIHPISQ